MTQLAVETQADVMQQAFPSIEQQTDYQFAQHGIPGNLVQVEALLHVQPENEQLLLLATQGLTSYGYGFIEDDMAQAEIAGDLERADFHRARARAMYLKARDYGLRLLRLMGELPDPLPRDPDQLARVLAAEFSDPETAPALLWTGNAWGAAVNVSRDDPALIADLPYATVLVERSVALDEDYYHAAGHMLLGIANASLGEAMGGDPERGRAHFEKALALSDRKALLVHVSYAESYAVHKQDKALFRKLLEEALAKPVGAGTSLALPNTIAQRRARRLLSQTDMLILESLDALPAGDQTADQAPETAPNPPPTAAPPAPDATNEGPPARKRPANMQEEQHGPS